MAARAKEGLEGTQDAPKGTTADGPPAETQLRCDSDPQPETETIDDADLLPTSVSSAVLDTEPHQTDQADPKTSPEGPCPVPPCTDQPPGPKVFSNPLVVVNNIRPTLGTEWTCVVVAHGYTEWLKTNPPIPGFDPHMEFVFPAVRSPTYNQFLADLRIRLFMPQHALLSLFVYAPAWEKLMQLVEQNWDTYVRQMRDLVLSGQALRDGKLNNAAYISWRYINFAAVRESVHFVFDLIQAT